MPLTQMILHMQRLGFVIIALVLTITCLAQETDSLTFSLDHINQPRLFESFPRDTFPKHDFGVEVGSSVFTDFDGGYGFNTYVAPRFSLRPAEKIQFDVFAFAGRSNYYDMPVWIYPGVVTKLDQNFSHLGLNIQGTYFINEKVYVGGSAFVDHLVPENKLINPALGDLTNYGGGAYGGYKFSENFKVEVGFEMSKYPTYPNGIHRGGSWGDFNHWPGRNRY